MAALSYVARFVPGETGRTPLVLLHGSDGGETDLVDLAEHLAPAAPKLALRGTVSTPGGFAFVRRRPDRSIDEADTTTTAPVLAHDIRALGAQHRIEGRPVALGYSNGAIMAAALLMSCPGLLSGAILLRPLSPYAEPPGPVEDVPVLVIDGAEDARRSPGDGRRLAEQLRRCGASVTHHVLPTGHAVTEQDRTIARAWLDQLPTSTKERP